MFWQTRASPTCFDFVQKHLSYSVLMLTSQTDKVAQGQVSPLTARAKFDFFSPTYFVLPNLLTSILVQNVSTKPSMSIKYVKTSKLKAVASCVNDCKRRVLHCI